MSHIDKYIGDICETIDENTLLLIASSSEIKEDGTHESFSHNVNEGFLFAFSK